LTAAEAVALDDAAARWVASGASPPLVRVWQNERAVVLPRRAFERLGVRAVLGRDGSEWPVVPRSSGGTAVAHGPGTLNVSVILPQRRLDDPPIEEGYRLWVELLDAALRPAYGIPVEGARVEGAFCEGAWDASVGGRKLAGTAQSRRGGGVVVHGTILVDVDRREYVSLLEAVEGARYDADRLVTVRELAGRAVTPAEVAALVRRAVPGWTSGRRGL
jgi:lipoate-protein ligase A